MCRKNAIDLLRNDYDYIFIDSAPTSTVSDTIVCARVADATVYVCRAHVTFKSSLKLINEFTDRKKLINTSLVVNAVREYKSGYGFKFGYGYVYGNGKEKKSSKKLFSLKSYFEKLRG